MHRHELKLAGTVVAWMWELSEVNEVRQPARGAGGPGISVTTSLRACLDPKFGIQTLHSKCPVVL
jgi:hypothetical protein